jgi:hypothetical protein
MIEEMSIHEIREILERTDEAVLMRLDSLLYRGVELTPMQLRLMFFPRGYGKTFMSMCNLMMSMEEHDEFKVSFDVLMGERLPSIIPEDEDLDGSRMRNEDYIMKLIGFVNEYYPEYSIIKKDRQTIILNKKVYI